MRDRVNVNVNVVVLVSVLVSVPRVAGAEEAVYVEALGRGGAYGVGGEIAVRERVAVGAAASFLPADGERVATFSPYLHVEIVARGAHAWFVDVGPSVVHRSIPSPVPEWGGVSDTSLGGVVTTGHEVAGDRLFLRSSISLAIGPGGVAPWGGVALGMRF